MGITVQSTTNIGICLWRFGIKDGFKDGGRIPQIKRNLNNHKTCDKYYNIDRSLQIAATEIFPENVLDSEGNPMIDDRTGEFLFFDHHLLRYPLDGFIKGFSSRLDVQILINGFDANHLFEFDDKGNFTFLGDYTAYHHKVTLEFRLQSLIKKD
jgi:hypothetical protein